MDKKIAGLLGAVAALTSLPAAQAAPNVDLAQAMRAASYADLLTPVSNAVEVLKADDAARASQPATEQVPDGVQVAQYHHHHHQRRVIIIHRHHHHHHNWRPMRRHHHHHHSHYMAVPRDNA